MHCLLELNWRIVKDLGRINSITAKNIIPSLSGEVTENQNGGCKLMEPRSPIGGVFESSQIFLELLRRLRSDYYSNEESECSYSEYQNEIELPCLNSDDQFFGGVSSQNSTIQLSTKIAAISQSSHAPTPVDMPVTLMILTCYITPLHTYETIFAKIQESLFSQERFSKRDIPPLLPGLHIGGFHLNNHKDLQIDILIHLSCSMLERVKET